MGRRSDGVSIVFFFLDFLVRTGLGSGVFLNGMIY